MSRASAQRQRHLCSCPALLAALLLSGLGALSPRAKALPPALRGRGQATQLIVDGKPFLMLAGELANSSPSSLARLEPAWARLPKMRLNTVLAPCPGS